MNFGPVNTGPANSVRQDCAMVDLGIVLAFVAYSIGNGFRHQARASESLEEYFLAGRSVKGWQAGISLAATQFAADTPLLVAGLIATGGIFMLWRLWIYGLGFLMIGFLLGPAWRRARVITDAELTEIRYSGKGVLALRGLKAIYYGTVMNCTIMAMVLVAAMRISEVFLPWNEWLPGGVYGVIYHVVKSIGIPLASGSTGLETYVATTNNLLSILVIIAFTALYSTTGGLRSVIATDTVQFSLAMLGTLMYAIVVMAKSGGADGIVANLVKLYGDAEAGRILSFRPNAADALMPFLVIISLQWFFERNSDGTGYFAQRMMSCRSPRDARFAAFIFSWLQIFLRNLIGKHRKQGRCQSHDETQGKEQGDPGNHGHKQPHFPTLRLLPFWKATRNDGDKNNVVDPQDNFQYGQGDKGDPYLRIEYPVHDFGSFKRS